MLRKYEVDVFEGLGEIVIESLIKGTWSDIATLLTDNDWAEIKAQFKKTANNEEERLILFKEIECFLKHWYEKFIYDAAQNMTASKGMDNFFTESKP